VPVGALGRLELGAGHRAVATRRTLARSSRTTLHRKSAIEMIVAIGIIVVAIVVEQRRRTARAIASALLVLALTSIQSLARSNALLGRTTLLSSDRLVLALVEISVVVHVQLGSGNVVLTETFTEQLLAFGFLLDVCAQNLFDAFLAVLQRPLRLNLNSRYRARVSESYFVNISCFCEKFVRFQRRTLPRTSRPSSASEDDKSTSFSSSFVGTYLV
jgi:hypothetical protein